MTEVSPPPSRSRKGIKRSINDLPFAESLNAATKKCPGCLYNCYIMEESIGLDYSSIGAFIRSAFFLLLEIPTVYQMAKIMANREKTGWGKDIEVKTEKNSNILH